MNDNTAIESVYKRYCGQDFTGDQRQEANSESLMQCLRIVTETHRRREKENKINNNGCWKSLMCNKHNTTGRNI